MTNFRYRTPEQAATAIRRIADHNKLVVVIKTPEEVESDLTAQLAREASIADDTRDDSDEFDSTDEEHGAGGSNDNA